MYRTYKFRLRPNVDQINKLNKMLDLITLIHDLYSEHYFTIKDMSSNDILTYFLSLHKELKEGDQAAFLLEIKELSNSKTKGKRNKKIFKYSTNYFRSIDKKNTPYDDKHIYLPSIGSVYYYNGSYTKNIKYIYRYTVYKTINEKFYIDILSVKVPSVTVKKQLDVQDSVGLDYSSSNFYVDNKGNSPTTYHNLKDNSKLLEELRIKIARLPKDCPQYKNALKRYILLHGKFARQRKDCLHKLSTSLADKYDYIFVESINLSEVATHRHQGKAVIDNSYGKFLKMLEYKMNERGKKLVQIDRYYPSSKKCNYCGYVIDSLTLKQRTWQCPNCHMNHNRDINAAINIRNKGIELVMEKAGGQSAWA